MSDTDGFTPLTVLAKTIYGESRGEIAEGKQAVASVILNRVKLNGWMGHDVKSVCLKPYQFSCWLDSDPNRPKIMAVTETNPTYVECLNVAKLAIAGNLPDNTFNADSYERTGADAPWARNLTPTTVIGNHTFYRTVSRPTDTGIEKS